MAGRKKKLIRVALCGRRNAGKSTLFNAILGKRRAITDSLPGLTRDVLEAEVRRENYHFLLSDTPGLDVSHPDELEANAIKRATDYLEGVDILILLFDSSGLNSYDHQLLAMMRKIDKPVIHVVNKIDSQRLDDDRIFSFYEAGLENVIPVSAAARWNIRQLLRTLSEFEPELKSRRSEGGSEADYSESDDSDDQSRRSTTISDSQKTDLKVAIVGCPNAGKSSLLNRLASREVSIVSEVPGTTRDTIDEIVTYHGRRIRLIDTAGLRKKSYLTKKGRNADFFSISRTQRAIRDCDVVVHLIDAQKGAVDFDKKIAALIKDSGRSAVIAINKWDTISDKETNTLKNYKKDFIARFPHSHNYPFIFCSALTGQRIESILNKCLTIFDRMQIRISTPEINKLVHEWNSTLKKYGSDGKVYYAVQLDGHPPSFIFFVNQKRHFRSNNLLYFENQLRKRYKLEGVPLTFILKEKERRERK